jgi:hypothetical protein
MKRSTYSVHFVGHSLIFDHARYKNKKSKTLFMYSLYSFTHIYNNNNNNVNSTLTSKDLAGSSGRRPQYDAGINLNPTTAHNSLSRGHSENTNDTE